MIPRSPKTITRTSGSFLAAAAALSLFSSAASAETADIKVPKVVVATAMNAAFSTMKVRLDNFGAKHGTSWLENDSFILLPGGSRRSFDIPEHSYNIGPFRKLRHYLNDLQTSSITTAVNGDALAVTASFESQGEEIKGKCIRRLFGKWDECSLSMERDIHLDNSRLTLAFVPVAHKGSISIGTPSVDFKTDLKIASKLCQAFNGICGKIENNIKGKLTSQIEAIAAAQLKSSVVRDAIAKAVRNAATIKNLINPKWEVTRVSSQGSNYVVTVERPDTIGQDSVTSLTLKPKVASLTKSCPAEVKLDATIKMKDTVSGTGFLRYENGQNSGEWKWRAKAGQTVTSTVTRPVEGKPGQAVAGKARMVVAWKGTDGDTYTRESNLASFTVKCTKAVGGLVSN